MKQLLMGLGISIIPMIFTLIVKRGTTRKIGRGISKLLRTRLGRKLENAIELTLVDLVEGMREDNQKQIAKTKEKEEAKKKIERLMKRNPL